MPEGFDFDSAFRGALPEPEAVPEEPAESTETTEPGETEPATADAGTGDASEPQDAPDVADDTDEIDTSAEPATPQGLEAALGIAIKDVADSVDDEDDGDDISRSERRRRRPSPAPRKRRGAGAKVLSFFVLLLLIAGIGGAAFFLNQKIMMWMPATQRLYAMIGIKPHVLGQGLQIVEPTPKKEIDGNDEILIVEGEIRNVTAKPLDIPLMRGALLDKQGKELHIWTFTAAKSNVAPGENAPYRTEFRNPPTDAESLDITFTRANEVKGMATQEVKMKTEPDATSKEGMTEDGEKDGTEKTH